MKIVKLSTKGRTVIPKISGKATIWRRERNS